MCDAATNAPRVYPGGYTLSVTVVPHAQGPHLSTDASGVCGCAALKAAPGLLPAVAARTERVRCTARPAAAENAAGALLPATKPLAPRPSFGSLPSLGASLSSPPSAARQGQDNLRLAQQQGTIAIVLDSNEWRPYWPHGQSTQKDLYLLFRALRHLTRSYLYQLFTAVDYVTTIMT